MWLKEVRVRVWFFHRGSIHLRCSCIETIWVVTIGVWSWVKSNRQKPTDFLMSPTVTETPALPENLMDQSSEPSCLPPSRSKKLAEKDAQHLKSVYSSMVFSDVVKENIGAWTSWSMELKGLESNEPGPKQGMFPVPLVWNPCNSCTIWLQNGHGQLIAMSLHLSEGGCSWWLFSSGLTNVCWVWDA